MYIIFLIDLLFKSGMDYHNKLLKDDNIIFYNSYYGCNSNQTYSPSPLPGSKEGISGSYIGGYNLGINRYISNKQKKAAIKAFEIITSKEIQKKFVMNDNIFSGIPSLYNDKEVCKEIDCQFFKKFQFIGRPSSSYENYDYYSEFFRKHIYDFLYGNKTASEVLNEINDITKIHYITINDDEMKDSKILGFAFIYIILILLSVMLFSIIFLFISKYEGFFHFLSKDFWILTVLGSLIILGAGFTEIGQKKNYKCNIKLILLSIGFSLIILPVLYVLIVYYPEKNKISRWIKTHKYKYLLLLIIPDLITFISFFDPTLTIKEIQIENGKYYEVCKFIKSSVIAILIIKFIIFFAVTILLLIEWSAYSTSDDFRLLILNIFLNTVYLITLLIIYLTKINNYKIYFIIQEFIIVLLSITNYIFLYGLRILWILINKNYSSQLEFSKNTSSIKSLENDKTPLLNRRSTYSRRLTHQCSTLESINSRFTSNSFDKSTKFSESFTTSPYNSNECLKQSANENMKQCDSSQHILSLFQKTNLFQNSTSHNVAGSNNSLSINISKN